MAKIYHSVHSFTIYGPRAARFHFGGFMARQQYQFSHSCLPASLTILATFCVANTSYPIANYRRVSYDGCAGVNAAKRAESRYTVDHRLLSRKCNTTYLTPAWQWGSRYRKRSPGEGIQPVTLVTHLYALLIFEP